MKPLQSSTGPAPNKNIENNPMHSSMAVAGMCDASDTI
jgi:hypothetical protein